MKKKHINSVSSVLQKRKYQKPFSKVLQFHTMYDSMVQGEPQGSYTVHDLIEDDPITIGGDDDDNPAKYGKTLWDVNF